LTFRPRVSQVTSAHGGWKDRRWTVVLRRRLQVSPDVGLELSGGARCSIAFALWDGAARDRDGQKLVSIWHDLELE
jgi:DMSO reductase family type II enzyme heme b subunit